MKSQTAVNATFFLTLLGLFLMNRSQQEEISRLRAGLPHTDPPPRHGPLLAPDGHSSAPDKLFPATGRPGPAPSEGTQDAPPSRGEFQKMASELRALQKRVESSRPAGKTGSFSLSGQAVASVPLTATPETEADFGDPDGEISHPAAKAISWNHAQATGAPDTVGGGDKPTAWAPRSPRSGEQWLQLGYDKAVEIGSLNVMETHNPGAISRVTALMPDGSEREIWKGTSPAGEAPVETTVPVPPGISSDQVRIYVDTDRVASWPEIDAVEMVGKDGSRQWASSSKASSSYGGE